MRSSHACLGPCVSVARTFPSSLARRVLATKIAPRLHQGSSIKANGINVHHLLWIYTHDIHTYFGTRACQGMRKLREQVRTHAHGEINAALRLKVCLLPFAARQIEWRPRARARTCARVRAPAVRTGRQAPPQLVAAPRLKPVAHCCCDYRSITVASTYVTCWRTLECGFKAHTRTCWSLNAAECAVELPCPARPFKVVCCNTVAPIREAALHAACMLQCWLRCNHARAACCCASCIQTAARLCFDSSSALEARSSACRAAWHMSRHVCNIAHHVTSACCSACVRVMVGGARRVSLLIAAAQRTNGRCCSVDAHTDSWGVLGALWNATPL